MRSALPITFGIILLVTGVMFFFLFRSGPVEVPPEPSPFRYSGPPPGAVARIDDREATPPADPSDELLIVAELKESEPEQQTEDVTDVVANDDGDPSTIPSVVGRVTDRFGRPVAGATVTARTIETSNLGVAGDSSISQLNIPVYTTTSTDAEGRYALIGERRTWGLVMAEADGHASVISPLRASPRPTITVDLQLAEELPLRGIVVDQDGEPLEDVQIDFLTGIMGMFASPGGGGQTAFTVGTTFTEADGRFALRGAGDMMGMAQFFKVGYGAETLALMNLNPREELRVVLSSATGVLFGRVHTWDESEGIPNAIVRYSAVGTGLGMLMMELNAPEVLTDEEGRFEIIGVPAGSLLVTATTEDGRRPLLAFGTIAEPVDMRDGERVEVNLPIPDAFAIQGLVLDARDRTPIAGATVEGLTAIRSQRLTTTTDEEGRFQFLNYPGTSLEAGQLGLHLVAEADGFSREEVKRPIPESGALGDETFEILLTPLVRVSGIVVSPNGVPIANAEVTEAVDFHGGETRSERSALTTPNGQFAIELPSNKVLSLRAIAEGYAHSYSETIAVRDEPIDGIRLVLDPGGALDVRVMDEAGNPLQGIDVWVSIVGEQRTETTTGGSSTNQLIIFAESKKSDAAGRAIFDRVPSDGVRLSSFAERFRNDVVAMPSAGLAPAGEEFTIQPRETTLVELVLEEPQTDGIVEGIVRNPDGNPAPGVSVMAFSDDGMPVSGRTNGEGRFRLEGLDSRKDYSLSARSAEHGTAWLFKVHFDGREHEILLASDKLELTIIVLDAETKEPLPGATVEQQIRRDPMRRGPVQGTFVVQTSRQIQLRFIVEAAGYRSQQLIVPPDNDRPTHIAVVELVREEG